MSIQQISSQTLQGPVSIPNLYPSILKTILRRCDQKLIRNNAVLDEQNLVIPHWKI